MYYVVFSTDDTLTPQNNLEEKEGKIHYLNNLYQLHRDRTLLGVKSKKLLDIQLTVAIPYLGTYIDASTFLNFSSTMERKIF